MILIAVNLGDVKFDVFSQARLKMRQYNYRNIIEVTLNDGLG